MAASLGDVHKFVPQLIFDHWLDGDILRAVLSIQVVDQDLYLADSIFRNKAKNSPQAVEKPIKGINKKLNVNLAMSWMMEHLVITV